MLQLVKYTNLRFKKNELFEMTATCDHLGQVTVIFLDSTVLLTGNCDEEHLISNVC